MVDRNYANLSVVFCVTLYLRRYVFRYLCWCVYSTYLGTYVGAYIGTYLGTYIGEYIGTHVGIWSVIKVVSANPLNQSLEPQKRLTEEKCPNHDISSYKFFSFKSIFCFAQIAASKLHSTSTVDIYLPTCCTQEDGVQS